MAFLIFPVFLWNCGEAPPAPVELIGTIEVTGILPDDALPDSISVTLDDIYLGDFPNPHTLSVVAGTHLLQIGAVVEISADSVISYIGAPERVEVLDDQDVSLTVHLTTDVAAPYVGFKAPDFSVSDLDGNPINLTDLNGKIALLYFFSFT